MRAACPRAGGMPDWPAPVCGSPRKPCRARCARLARARADRAAAAPTPGPSLTAADRPGGMRAGAPSCGKAGDACGDLQRARTGLTELAQACTVRPGQVRATSVPRAANACATRLCETVRSTRAPLRGGAGPIGCATATRCADSWRRRHGAGVRRRALAGGLPCARRVAPRPRSRCTVETGLTSVMHASNRDASRHHDATVRGHAETGTRRGRRARSTGLARGARGVGRAGRCRSGRCRGHGARGGAGDGLGAGLAALAAGAAEHGDDCQHGCRTCAEVAGHGCLLAPARGQRMRRQVCLVLL
ncbi:hypothetical protein C7414_10994 [Cupriavidus alkaliphilus]|nr:hypothetical protein C7414_10994 [Cupriavidus alkaliphilus]